jgi:Putative Ig domain
MQGLEWRGGLITLVVALSAAAMGQAGAGQKSSPATGIQIAPKNSSSQASENEQSGGLVIEPAELPLAYPHGPYQVNLRAHGNFVPVLQWTVSQGSLPPGITLDANGILRGEARRAGEFQFMVTVRDGGKPQLAVQKAYVIKVLDAVTVVWKVPAHVNVSRIEGSVEVSNATIDDVDLTFDVKAVAEDGRATEIGYQHFPLKRGTIGMALPFGENLPHGAYMVYVNVNGEVAKRNVIYKKRLQTKAALQVVVGP